MKRLWDKGEPLDSRILRYTAGEDHLLDARLVPYDVRASIAHAQMLHGQKLLSADDLSQIIAGLESLAVAHAAGDWHISLEDEDCHTALEQRLTQMIGEAGRRVHLGRSRNDQVLVALRLYLLDAAEGIAAAARDVAAALDELAAREQRHRAARLHPHAAGHAELRAPVGGRLRGRTPRRRRGHRGQPPAAEQEPARQRRRLRRAGPAHRPGGDPPHAGLRRRARAGHRRADLPRQGRSRAGLRAGPAHPGPGPDGGRPAAVLHAGIPLHRTARHDDHGLVDHAPEAQPRRARAGARRRADDAGGAGRRSSACRPSSAPATSATCSG